MRYAIISDIHSNLEALTAVLEDSERRSVGTILCLGDIVGYGADPKECLRVVEEISDEFIQGNHDEAAATGSGIEYFNEHAAQAARWTAERLSDEEKVRLAALPLETVNERMHLVHGSPQDPGAWHYIVSERDAGSAFASSDRQVLFVGHSHVPGIFVELEYKRVFSGEMRRVKQIAADSTAVESPYRYVINVGSVGQPRDGDARASYGIFDSDESVFSLHRVHYDIEKAAKKIRKAGLPPELAERLFFGM